jgi:hypothetical protein
MIVGDHKNWTDGYGYVVLNSDQSLGLLNASYMYPAGYYNRHLASAKFNRYVFGFDIIPSLNLIAVSNYAYGMQLVKYDATDYHSWWKNGLHNVKHKTIGEMEAEIGTTYLTDFRDVRAVDDNDGNVYLYCVDIYYGLVVLQINISTYDMTVVADSKYDHPDWPIGTNGSTKFPYSRTWECELSNDNNYLYVTAVEGIFLVYDISNRTNPVLLSELTLGDINPNTNKRTNAVYVPSVDPGNNDLVYVPTIGGIYILDVSNPSDIKELGYLPLYSKAQVGDDDRRVFSANIIPKISKTIPEGDWTTFDFNKE